MSDARDEALLGQLGGEARARAAAARQHEASLPAARREAAADAILAALATTTNERPRVARAGWPLWAVAMAALPAAAAAAFVLLSRSPAHEAFASDYVVEVRGRVETERARGGAVSATLQARDGALEQVLVRPHEATEGPVAAKVLAVRGTIVAPADVEPEVSDLGVVRFDVPGERLRGVSELRVIIAPPAALDGAVKSASEAMAPTALRDAVLVRLPVEPPGS